jgi:hypothetical protein
MISGGLRDLVFVAASIPREILHLTAVCVDD